MTASSYEFLLFLFILFYSFKYNKIVASDGHAMNGNQIEEEEESLVPKKGLIYSILVSTSFFFTDS